ncbi:20073_t:CDS:2 [Funneliformis geosporum]|nr:20073_t:CDS:2 [Funneliformis geosporum]
MIKDLDKIRSGSFEIIHIFAQIFPGTSLIGKHPSRDTSTNYYPHLFAWNNLIDCKEVCIIADTESDKVENVDITTGKLH